VADLSLDRIDYADYREGPDVEGSLDQREAYQGGSVLYFHSPGQLDLQVLWEVDHRVSRRLNIWREISNQDPVLFLQMPGNASCS
jgi:hypothetical protein